MQEVFKKIQSLNFLLVDDYESMRMLLAENLDDVGIENIQFAVSGNTGFELLKSKLGTADQINYVITDMIMDNGTGSDLTKLIRSHDELKKLPILMITSKAEIEYVLEAVDAGVDGYIMKPWTPEILKEKLVECFNKRNKA